MKLAKVLFISILVFAFAGGLFAFRTSRVSHSVFITNGVAGQCVIEALGLTLTSNGSPGVTRYATLIAGQCMLKAVYVTD